ncbi:hypothetical protein D3C80_1963810 [compost metagenome]
MASLFSKLMLLGWPPGSWPKEEPLWWACPSRSTAWATFASMWVLPEPVMPVSTVQWHSAEALSWVSMRKRRSSL